MRCAKQQGVVPLGRILVLFAAMRVCFANLSSLIFSYAADCCKDKGDFLFPYNMFLNTFFIELEKISSLLILSLKAFLLWINYDKLCSFSKFFIAITKPS